MTDHFGKMNGKGKKGGFKGFETKGGKHGYKGGGEMKGEPSNDYHPMNAFKGDMFPSVMNGEKSKGGKPPFFKGAFPFKGDHSFPAKGDGSNNGFPPPFKGGDTSSFPSKETQFYPMPTIEGESENGKGDVKGNGFVPLPPQGGSFPSRAGAPESIGQDQQQPSTNGKEAGHFMAVKQEDAKDDEAATRVAEGKQNGVHVAPIEGERPPLPPQMINGAAGGFPPLGGIMKGGDGKQPMGVLPPQAMGKGGLPTPPPAVFPPGMMRPPPGPGQPGGQGPPGPGGGPPPPAPFMGKGAFKGMPPPAPGGGPPPPHLGFGIGPGPLPPQPPPGGPGARPPGVIPGIPPNVAILNGLPVPGGAPAGGGEQVDERALCPFYMKIGACRHGDQCSRQHPKPTSAQGLLLAHMYPNTHESLLIATEEPWTDEMYDKAQAHIEQFYSEVFLELANYGEIEDMVVVDNASDHMIGNVYVKYYDEGDCERALQKLSGRFYGGKLIQAEASPVQDFREARCRAFHESRCNRGGYCNFMHIKHIPKAVKRRLVRMMYEEHPEYGGALPEQVQEKDRSRSRRRGKSPASSEEDDAGSPDAPEGEATTATGAIVNPYRRRNSEERRALVAQWNRELEAGTLTA